MVGGGLECERFLGSVFDVVVWVWDDLACVGDEHALATVPPRSSRAAPKERRVERGVMGGIRSEMFTVILARRLCRAVGGWVVCERGMWQALDDQHRGGGLAAGAWNPAIAALITRPLAVQFDPSNPHRGNDRCPGGAR